MVIFNKNVRNTYVYYSIRTEHVNCEKKEEIDYLDI